MPRPHPAVVSPRPPPASTEAPLATQADAWRFFLPLAFTSIMMASSTPIINAGLARLADAERELAAFALCFQFSVFLNSLTFGIEATGIHLMRGAQSFRRFLALALVVGGALSALELAMGWTPLGFAVFHGIYGVDAELADLARRGLVFLSPLPIVIAVRGVYRSVHIRLGTTRSVGFATLARLAVLAASTWVGMRLFPEHGVAVGASVLTLGIATEAAHVAWSARPHVRALLAVEEHDTRSVREVAGFVLPVLVSQVTATAMGPLIDFTLAHTTERREALAAWGVARSVAWLLSSLLFAGQQLTVARTRTPAERRVAIGFVARLAVVIAALVGIISWPPVGRFVIGDVGGVSGSVLTHAIGMFWVFPVGVIVLGTRMALRGLAVRGDRPRDPLAAGTLGLVAGFTLGWVMKDAVPHAALVGGIMWASAGLVETVYLLLRERAHPTRIALSGESPPPESEAHLRHTPEG